MAEQFLHTEKDGSSNLLSGMPDWSNGSDTWFSARRRRVQLPHRVLYGGYGEIGRRSGLWFHREKSRKGSSPFIHPYNGGYSNGYRGWTFTPVKRVQLPYRRFADVDMVLVVSISACQAEGVGSSPIIHLYAGVV